MDIELVPTQQNLDFGEHCNTLMDKIRDISRSALSDKKLTKDEQKIFSEVLSVINRNNKISVYRQFLDAQKALINLIPKSKQGEIYKGFSSIFEHAVKAYVFEEREKYQEEVNKKSAVKINSLRDRVEELESLCYKHNIKHSLTKEDVLGKGYQGGV